MVLAVVLIAVGTWLLTSDDGEAPPSEPAAPTTMTNTTAPREPSARARADEGFEQPDDSLDLRRTRAETRDGGASDGAAGVAAAPVVDDLIRAQLQVWLRDNAETATKRVDEYCEATKKLTKEPSDPPSRSRDAALYMAGRTDWEDGHTGLLHLPDLLTERLRNPPGAWRRFGPEVYAGLDFSWMKELLQFDTWSIATASPLRDVAEVTTYFDAPLPNFVTLQHWSKLRLLKGLHENDLASASLEVRHLADLIGTTNTLVGDMVRVALFGIERGFLEEHGIALVPMMTLSEQQQRRHAAFAGLDFLLPGVDRAVRAKALKCIPNRCSALMESLGTASALKGIVPGLDDHVQWLREQATCDPAMVELTTRLKPMHPGDLLDSLGERSLDDSMQKLLEALDGGVH